MMGKKDKNKSKPGLSKKDAALWKAMTADVRLMPGRNYEENEEDNFHAQEEKIIERVGVEFRETQKQPKGRGVDKRTAQKLERGKMVIEGTLDLHGMNQQEARTALARFIKSSYERGRRCVLVITGKGNQDKPGVLKARVPEWLNEAPLEELVLKTAQAKQHDGGLGAIYVLLRRSRS
ncbi:MAG: Smr/MutS family protein [Micavibrio sp.]|nr:Smr/MutS family protein [Micavibrio sp.]